MVSFSRYFTVCFTYQPPLVITNHATKMSEQVVLKVYTQFNLSFRQRSSSCHVCFIRYSLDTSPGGAQGGSGRSEENKYILYLHGTAPQFLGHPIQILVNLPNSSKETDFHIAHYVHCELIYELHQHPQMHNSIYYIIYY
jgi:hypothetical protein